jgi:hypothetical protein
MKAFIRIDNITHLVDIEENDLHFLDQLQLDKKMAELYKLPKATKDSPEIYEAIVRLSGVIVYTNDIPKSTSMCVTTILFKKEVWKWPKYFEDKEFYAYRLK